MSINVPNTRRETPRVTLFGRLDDGHHVAKVMDETSVPYSRYWDNAVEQVMVYIEPEKEQLDSVLAALDQGKLRFEELQEYGDYNGGTSTIPT